MLPSACLQRCVGLVTAAVTQRERGLRELRCVLSAVRCVWPVGPGQALCSCSVVEARELELVCDICFVKESNT